MKWPLAPKIVVGDAEVPLCVKEVAPANAGAKPNEVLLLAARHAAAFAFVGID